MALKELEARYATKRAKDYKLADGEGLYLLVRANGSKLWRFMYRFDGKEKLLAFGVYPAVSLAAARLRRAEAKVALGQGRDPGAKDAPDAVMTFEQAARAWHTHRLAALDKSHAERPTARLERDTFPALGRIDPRRSPLPMSWRWCAASRRAPRSTSAGASSSMSARSTALPFRRAGRSVTRLSILAICSR